MVSVYVVLLKQGPNILMKDTRAGFDALKAGSDSIRCIHSNSSSASATGVAEPSAPLVMAIFTVSVPLTL